MDQRGTPYAWGGASPGGFDCSGLVSFAFARVGKTVPHNTNAIWSAFRKVPRSGLRVGDMVFFSGLGHVGIYVGGGRYVHSPHSGDVVRVEPSPPATTTSGRCAPSRGAAARQRIR